MTEHAPNTPRVRNAKGQRVDEPVQCLRCLQAWPCEVELLRREVAKWKGIAARNDDGLDGHVCNDGCSPPLHLYLTAAQP